MTKEEQQLKLYEIVKQTSEAYNKAKKECFKAYEVYKTSIANENDAYQLHMKAITEYNLLLG